MKNSKFGVLVFLLSFGMGLGSGAAYAYDEAKCKSGVEKLKKFLKAYKTVKLKDFLEEVDNLDELAGGVTEDSLKEIFDMPFDDIKWVKKYQDVRDDVRKDCTLRTGLTPDEASKLSPPSPQSPSPPAQ